MKLIPNLAELDRKTIQQAGIPAERLMEAAGNHVATAVQRHCEPNQKTVIICGPGNNGGDGFVCARQLHRAGYRQLSIVYTGNNYRNEALTSFEQLMTLPVEMINARKQAELALKRISRAQCIVDALFGSGLARPITGIEAQLVEAINAHHQSRETEIWTVAVDLPSGVDGLTGQVWGTAVQANHTVTFAAAKPGLFLFPGRQCAGQVQIVDIGIPQVLVEEDDSPVRLIVLPQAAAWLPQRKPDGHKYDFGHVLVVAGSKRMPGAAVLTAEAALSAGAGLVTLAAPESVFSHTQLSPELIRLPLPESKDGAIALDTLTILQEAITGKRYHAIALGPGLGQTDETVRLVWQLLAFLQTQDIPIIVDADGLNALSRIDDADYHPDWPRPKLKLKNPRMILTPHVGECSRLLKQDKNDITADLLKAARSAQEVFAANIVLKSASTVVATTDGLLWISPRGNSGMATAGSGDVLSGIIAGLAAQFHAQGHNILPSAPLGVYLQGLAGDIAAEARTEYALRASDITAHLPNAFKVLLNPSET